MLVEDRPGIMARVSGMFARRGFNIETITVGKTPNEGVSRMVFTMTGDEDILEQVSKQMNKLIDVIKVSEFVADESIVSELCYIKVNIQNNSKKDDMLKLAEVYKLKIVDITHKSLIFQIVGKPEKIDSFTDLVRPYGIQEISRTGITAISRGSKTLEKNGSKKNILDD